MMQRCLRKVDKGKWHRAQTVEPTPKLVTEIQQAAANQQPKKEKPSLRDIKRRVILDYAFHDLVNGEKVFTKKSEPIILERLAAEVGAELAVVCHDYGDVLNRFG